jgi:hypothetical protein
LVSAPLAMTTTKTAAGVATDGRCHLRNSVITSDI